MSEHCHLWRVVERPEPFPGRAQAAVECDCGHRWVTTPERMFIKSALAVYRDPSLQAGMNFRTMAQLFIETDSEVTTSGLNDHDQRSAIGMARSWVDKREPNTAFTERKSILWTSPPVAPCPGNGHHNWEHGNDACECGAIAADDLEAEEADM